MIKIKEIEKKYRVYKTDSNQYQIYDLGENSGKRMVRKYYCLIEKNNSNNFKIIKSDKANNDVIWEDKYYNNINDLDIAIKDYVNSLDFDSELYMPLYCEGYFETAIIHDYLIDRGFKSDGGGFGIETYILQNKNIYTGDSSKIVLSIKGLTYHDEKISEEVKFILHTGNYSWIEVKCKRKPKEMISKIDSLLKPLFLYDGTINIKHSEKYSHQKFDANLNVLTNDLDKFSISYKNQLKEKLTEMLEKL